MKLWIGQLMIVSFNKLDSIYIFCFLISFSNGVIFLLERVILAPNYEAYSEYFLCLLQSQNLLFEHIYNKNLLFLIFLFLILLFNNYLLLFICFILKSLI